MAESDIFVPDYEQIQAMASLSKDTLDHDTVTIPTKLFKFLLGAVVQGSYFDEKAYCEAHPDIAQAAGAGQISSLRDHYSGTGWFEGRSPGEYYVDEQWYLSTYRDVALALRRGKLKDIKRHFSETGRAEGRVGSAEQALWKAKWESALGPVPKKKSLAAE
jgi:hypothetical protein